MKFSCYKNDLTEALQFLIRAVAVKPMTPILAGIYIKAEGSTLELQANNYSTGIISRIPASVENPGELVVSGKRFQEFMRGIPGETITFSDDENAPNILMIKAGGASLELMTMAADEFPKVKKEQAICSFSVDTQVMRDLIRKTIFAVAKEETRPVFTGCAFEIKDEEISVVATNAHRLALAKGKLISSSDDCKFIVPSDTLRGLLQRLEQRSVDKSINVDYSTRYLTFMFDNVIVNSRLIEGEFPPYDRVIPSYSETKVYINREEFKNTVEFIALMSKETEYNTVKFLFSNDKVEISSNSVEGESVVKSINASIEGPDVEISFNVSYILDVLRVIDSFKVVVALNDQFSPAAFSDPDEKDYIYVATPVRT